MLELNFTIPNGTDWGTITYNIISNTEDEIREVVLEEIKNYSGSTQSPEQQWLIIKNRIKQHETPLITKTLNI